MKGYFFFFFDQLQEISIKDDSFYKHTCIWFLYLKQTKKTGGKKTIKKKNDLKIKDFNMIQKIT